MTVWAEANPPQDQYEVRGSDMPRLLMAEFVTYAPVDQRDALATMPFQRDQLLQTLEQRGPLETTAQNMDTSMAALRSFQEACASAFLVIRRTLPEHARTAAILQQQIWSMQIPGYEVSSDAKSSVIAHLPTFIMASPRNRRAAEIGMMQVDSSIPRPTAADILAAHQRLDELMRQATEENRVKYDF